jgi:hypothetical protein
VSNDEYEVINPAGVRESTGSSYWDAWATFYQDTNIRYEHTTDFMTSLKAKGFKCRKIKEVANNTSGEKIVRADNEL